MQSHTSTTDSGTVVVHAPAGNTSSGTILVLSPATNTVASEITFGEAAAHNNSTSNNTISNAIVAVYGTSVFPALPSLRRRRLFAVEEVFTKTKKNKKNKNKKADAEDEDEDVDAAPAGVELVADGTSVPAVAGASRVVRAGARVCALLAVVTSPSTPTTSETTTTAKKSSQQQQFLLAVLHAGTMALDWAVDVTPHVSAAASVSEALSSVALIDAHRLVFADAAGQPFVAERPYPSATEGGTEEERQEDGNEGSMAFRDVIAPSAAIVKVTCAAGEAVSHLALLRCEHRMQQEEGAEQAGCSGGVITLEALATGTFAAAAQDASPAKKGANNKKKAAPQGTSAAGVATVRLSIRFAPCSSAAAVGINGRGLVGPITDASVAVVDTSAATPVATSAAVSAVAVDSSVNNDDTAATVVVFSPTAPVAVSGETTAVAWVAVCASPASPAALQVAPIFAKSSSLRGGFSVAASLTSETHAVALLGEGMLAVLHTVHNKGGASVLRVTYASYADSDIRDVATTALSSTPGLVGRAMAFSAVSAHHTIYATMADGAAAACTLSLAAGYPSDGAQLEQQCGGCPFVPVLRPLIGSLTTDSVITAAADEGTGSADGALLVASQVAAVRSHHARVAYPLVLPPLPTAAAIERVATAPVLITAPFGTHAKAVHQWPNAVLGTQRALEAAATAATTASSIAGLVWTPLHPSAVRSALRRLPRGAAALLFRALLQAVEHQAPAIANNNSHHHNAHGPQFFAAAGAAAEVCGHIVTLQSQIGASIMAVDVARLVVLLRAVRSIGSPSVHLSSRLDALVAEGRRKQRRWAAARAEAQALEHAQNDLNDTARDEEQPARRRTPGGVQGEELSSYPPQQSTWGHRFAAVSGFGVADVIDAVVGSDAFGERSVLAAMERALNNNTTNVANGDSSAGAASSTPASAMTPSKQQKRRGGSVSSNNVVSSPAVATPSAQGRPSSAFEECLSPLPPQQALGSGGAASAGTQASAGTAHLPPYYKAGLRRLGDDFQNTYEAGLVDAIRGHLH